MSAGTNRSWQLPDAVPVAGSGNSHRYLLVLQLFWQAGHTFLVLYVVECEILWAACGHGVLGRGTQLPAGARMGCRSSPCFFFSVSLETLCMGGNILPLCQYLPFNGDILEKKKYL